MLSDISLHSRALSTDSWCCCCCSFHALYIGMPINIIIAIMAVIWVVCFRALSLVGSVTETVFLPDWPPDWGTRVLFCDLINLNNTLTNCVTVNERQIHSRKTGFNKSGSYEEACLFPHACRWEAAQVNGETGRAEMLCRSSVPWSPPPPPPGSRS